jgi:hypothetical protein
MKILYTQNTKTTSEKKWTNNSSSNNNNKIKVKYLEQFPGIRKKVRRGIICE